MANDQTGVRSEQIGALRAAARAERARALRQFLQGLFGRRSRTATRPPFERAGSGGLPVMRKAREELRRAV